MFLFISQFWVFQPIPHLMLAVDFSTEHILSPQMDWLSPSLVFGELAFKE